jgi:hypothetical protein
MSNSSPEQFVPECVDEDDRTMDFVSDFWWLELARMQRFYGLARLCEESVRTTRGTNC